MTTQATFVQDANIIVFKNDTAEKIKYGDVVAMTDAIGIAVADITAGDVGNIRISGGSYNMPAETGIAFTQGMNVYWNKTTKVVTATAEGNVKAGVTISAKSTDGNTAVVKLG